MLALAKILLTALPIAAGMFLAMWLLVVLALWWQQDRLIFAGWGFRLVGASGLAEGDERLSFVTDDGVRLMGALRRARKPSRGLLLAFSGNAEDADWRLRHLGSWIDDLDIVTFFYRGFGPSGGVPDQAAIVRDAIMVHDRMVERLRPERVIAAGFSLGSGVAAQLARARPLAGAILVTPFDSVAAVAGARYPWVPVNWLIRHPFRSDEALAGLDLPVAVIGADRDRVVPPERTRLLIANLMRPVLVSWIEGASHVSLYERPEYRAAFSEGLRRILAEAAPPRRQTARLRPEAWAAWSAAAGCRRAPAHRRPHPEADA
ncbi:alpha/beta hydrolase [Benzoatithermus flavus]|uniref:Alpha/beta hydrolase n=1 Tax=Benzoatithermus flavus TaxID=3108223 RepID=A0ABU8XSV1_9PROT